MKNKRIKTVGTATVGTKGQIVIPREIREMFDIKPGDSLILFADSKRGIGILKSDFVTEMAEKELGNDE